MEVFPALKYNDLIMTLSSSYTYDVFLLFPLVFKSWSYVVSNLFCEVNYFLMICGRIGFCGVWLFCCLKWVDHAGLCTTWLSRKGSMRVDVYHFYRSSTDESCSPYTRILPKDQASRKVPWFDPSQMAIIEQKQHEQVSLAEDLLAVVFFSSLNIITVGVIVCVRYWYQSKSKVGHGLKFLSKYDHSPLL